MSESEDQPFVEAHRGLVEALARRIRAQLDLDSDIEDLVAFGFEGLLLARKRFDPTRGVRFTTFAYYRVRGAILDGVRKMAYLPRRAHEQARIAEATDTVLEEVSDTLAARGPISSEDDARDALSHSLGKIAACYVLSALGHEDAESNDAPDQAVLDKESHARVRRAVEALPEREAALVQGFYFEGRRFDEVARNLGISKSWASRTHAKALARLHEALSESED